MMLLGERIPSERALAWGMINRLAADAELMPEAMALARRLAEGPTLGFSLMRQLARRSLDSTLAEALAHERDAQRVAGYTEDFKGAVASFLAREPAVFHGR